MTSMRLVSTIEDHAEQLTGGLLDQIRQHPRTGEYHKLGESELHSRVYDVYHNLGRWIVDRSEQALEAEYEELGRHRSREGFPLSQVVFTLTLTRDHLFHYVDQQMEGWEQAPDQAEELGLVRLVTQFFDRAIFYCVVGYENTAIETARHRPEELMQGETVSGTFYPTHYVVAVIDAFDDAERAVELLRAAGFPSHEVHRWSGAELLHRFRSGGKQGGLRQAIAALFPSEARDVLDQYVHAANQGRQFVMVRASQPEDIERARPILAAHHGTMMRHYGEWAITDLAAA